MNKKITSAFGKEIYLLGKDKEGTLYWLESPSWDCGWHWGFGYVETYTNNLNPEYARDIKSHQHFDGLFFNKKCDYHKAWENHFAESVLSENEMWKLLELMKTFYVMRETSEIFGRGGSHITSNPCSDILKNEEKTKEINEVILPRIFEEVKKLLMES